MYNELYQKVKLPLKTGACSLHGNEMSCIKRFRHFLAKVLINGQFTALLHIMSIESVISQLGRYQAS